MKLLSAFASAAALFILGMGAANAQACKSPVPDAALVKKGALIMSINPTLPPLQFVNDKGELQGMRVELGNELAKTLGLTPEYVRIEFAAMVPGLAAKRWDMINTGIFWTEERSKLMYMVPYELAAISFLVSRGNPLNIAKWEDLAGRSVGVELGGIEERRTREVDDMLKKAVEHTKLSMPKTDSPDSAKSTTPSPATGTANTAPRGRQMGALR
jgi:polar amino acid transport system substrate-binding protein